jgi:hypothetical protein
MKHNSRRLLNALSFLDVEFPLLETRIEPAYVAVVTDYEHFLKILTLMGNKFYVEKKIMIEPFNDKYRLFYSITIPSDLLYIETIVESF